MAWTTPSTWASGDWNLQIRDNMNYMFNNLPPIGSVIPFAGRDTQLPDISTGWIPCDGRSLSTTGTYAALHTVIGYNYGGSGGSFLIPNTNGRAVFGVGNAGSGNNVNAIVNASGDSGGTNHGSHGHGFFDGSGAVTASILTNTATSGSGGSHGHGHVSSTLNHDHSFNASGNVTRAAGNLNAAAASHDHNHVPSTSSHGHSFASDGGHEHTVNSTSQINAGSTTADSSQAVDMRPPFIGMYYIIRYV